MLTLLLKANKRLIISKNQRIYQRETNIDTFHLYIPEKYDDKDLTGYDVYLQYIDPGNVAHSEKLEKITDITDDNNLIKEGYTLYWLPVDTKFTAVAGTVKMQLLICDVDQDQGTTIILRSSELQLEVMKVSDYFAYVDDSSLSAIDNKIAELKGLADSLNLTEERLDKEMPTDLTLDDRTIKLKQNDGTVVGDGVEINIGGYEIDSVDDGLVDLSDIEGGGSVEPADDPDGVDDGQINLSDL